MGDERSLCSDPLAVDVEQNRDREKSYTDETKEGGGPWDSQTVVHVCCEERKDGADDGSCKGVGCDGRG